MLTVALYVPGIHEFEALKETVLGHGCEEPGKVLVAQLVGFIVVCCVFDECCELSQLAGGVAFAKSMGASLSAYGAKDVGEGLPKRFCRMLHKCNDGAASLELFFAFW